MKKGSVAVVLVVTLGGAGAYAYLARAGFFRPDAKALADVPTLRLEPAPFVRIVRAEGFLKPHQSTMISTPADSRAILIDFLAEDGAQVKKGDVVVRFDDTDASRNLVDSRAEQQAANHKIARERTQIDNQLNERDRTTSLTQEELKRSKELGRKDPRFFPRNEVIESEIDEGLLTARIKQTGAARKVEEKLSRTRIEIIGVERRKAEQEGKNAALAMKRLEMKAPHDGTWVLQRWGNRTLQAGDRAFSGMRIGEVAMNDRMDAEVFVLEVDAGGLVSGKRAKVFVEARPDDALEAIVKQVDPFPKPKSPEIPAQYFGSILEIPMAVKGLKPGQRLHAEIIIEELPQALAVPRQAVFQNDKGAYVHRRTNSNSFEEVKVRMGPGTVGRVVLTEGVKSGDILALRDPKLSADETVADSNRKANRGSAPPAPVNTENRVMRRGR